MRFPIYKSAGSEHVRTIRSAVLACFPIWAMAAVVITSPGVHSANAANGGDPLRGKNLFEKRCTGCHSLDSDKEGPRLRNVYGRKAGSIPSFSYSDALKGARFTWDRAALDKWLIDTEAVVPDNNMDFHVPKTDERADIIEYLRVTSGR